MEKTFRIIYQTLDKKNPEVVLRQETLLSGDIIKPTNCLDLSITHEEQISLLQKTVDHILVEKSELINQDIVDCPDCHATLTKLGKRVSTFHDVFTDHEIKIQRMRCMSCSYEPPSTVRFFLNGTVMSGQLTKLQAELGAKHTFRDCEDILTSFSTRPRKINNHNRVKLTTEDIGNKLGIVNQETNKLIRIEEADELILNVDGGHIKTKEKEHKSFEAMTSVIYRPENILPNTTDTRNYLRSKACAASARNDGQEEIITNTIVAAISEGMTENTNITALSDGANNCWNVVEALRPLCKAITPILDWFHLSMKMENISLPDGLKSKFLRIRWHLWRGNTSFALRRLDELLEQVKNGQALTKIREFKTYIENNISRIVNYRERKKQGLVFTSNLAESTVESLINQRCKGQQHMKWTREGVNPVLQLRAQINSRDWENKWKMAVLLAL